MMQYDWLKKIGFKNKEVCSHVAID